MSQTKAQLLAPVGIFTAPGINVSGTLTATSYSGSGANLFGVGVGTTASVNTSGIITAVSFSGDGVNLSGVGFGTEDSAVTTGIVTASKFVGSGIGLTNIGGPIAGLVYSPSVGGTCTVDTNIEIIFSKPIQAGFGTITLRTDSATGTIIESYDISSSDRLTIDTAKLTIDPTSDLVGLTTYFVVIPSGTVKDTFVGISSNTAIDTYSFTSVESEFSGEMWVWGMNQYGQFGQNNVGYRSSPTQLPGTQWKEIGDGYRDVNAIKTDGTLWGFGLNSSGQLGVNSNAYNYSSPIQIPGTEWAYLGKGVYYSLATKNDGTLWAWGYNASGQLANNNTVTLSSPIQIPGTQWNITGKRKLGGGDYQYYPSKAIKNDGTLWTWGSNSAGLLGQNDTTPRSSPVQIPGTQWKSVTVQAALKNDGTLWIWGPNPVGQLGQNNATYYSSPVQIPGTEWTKIDYNRSTALGLKSDGTLWAWGTNVQGKLAQNLDANDLPSASSPRQIPGTQWETISMNYYAAHATKTDGTLWTWGDNAYGQLGLNDQTNRSSPTQVPGTQWYADQGDGSLYTAFVFKRV